MAETRRRTTGSSSMSENSLALETPSDQGRVSDQNGKLIDVPTRGLGSKNLVKNFGLVKIQKQFTVQVKQYEPVMVSIGFELPIEEGETPAESVGRVMRMVNEELERAADDVFRHGAYSKK